MLAIVLSSLISIHAPREGGDNINASAPYTAGEFQSTPPARGATSAMASMSEPPIFQSTPPRGGRRVGFAPVGGQLPISIHAPCEGGDMLPRTGTELIHISIHTPARGATVISAELLARMLFQSTPPARGAT